MPSCLRRWILPLGWDASALETQSMVVCLAWYIIQERPSTDGWGLEPRNMATNVIGYCARVCIFFKVVFESQEAQFNMLRMHRGARVLFSRSRL